MKSPRQPQRRMPRRYGFSCFACRRRKVKCDGRKPCCANCEKASEDCQYKEASSEVVRLRDQLTKVQDRVTSLEQQIKELMDLSGDERDQRLTELVGSLDLDEGEEKGSPVQSPASFASTSMHIDEKCEVSSHPATAEFTLDEEGRDQFYGATSRFHPLTPEGRSSIASCGQEEIKEERKLWETYHQRWLASNARFHKSWEKLAYERLKEHSDVDYSVSSTLLQIYWAWQAPVHNCVYRCCFFRDMALGGTYFSKFLLNAIFALACRQIPERDGNFAQFARGEYFLQKAKILLMEELDKEKPQIPTIQGLLILGGRQCAVGKHSEGWVYTGMANRMITDLGLHLNRTMTASDHLEPDDMEARKRLYLSAYVWDKSLSLCLGRPPSLTKLPYSPTTLNDCTDDEESWRPFRITSIEDSYPPTKSYNTLTFRYFCQLAEIINECYDTVYSKQRSAIKVQDIFRIEEKLRQFFQKLPDVLRIEDPTALEFCVPLHIFSLNILYRTMLILIYRPFFGWFRHAPLRLQSLTIRAQKVCLEEAAGVNEFFRLYGRTFNFQNQNYLVSYCVYTAATIEVQQIQHEELSVASMAAARLSTTLDMLESEAKQTPGIKRSIDIIKSNLDQQSFARLKDINSSSDGDESLPAPEKIVIEPPQSLLHNLGNPVSNLPQASQLVPPVSRLAYNSVCEENMLTDHSVGNILDDAMGLSGDFSDFPFEDAGGGFVPDIVNWAPFDPALFGLDS